MIKKLHPIVFFGNERLATGLDSSEAPTLKTLLARGYRISAVVTHQEPVKSRRQKTLETEQVAKANNLPWLTSTAELKKLVGNSQTLGILVAYGKILPDEVIKFFKLGIVNIHPSLLPRYRGPTPIEQAILDGAAETGVSLMRLSSAMDSGPIFAQVKVKIEPTESKDQLARKLLATGVDLLTEHLPDILAGRLKPVSQNDDHATYTKLISKDDGQINWSKSAVQIEREIRAYLGWPGSYTRLKGLDVIIAKARVVDHSGPGGKLFVEDSRLGVFCGSQALLIERIKPTGKNEMDIQAFLAGYRTKFGL